MAGSNEELLVKLRCLASLLQQLNAQTACAAVNEAMAALAPASGGTPDYSPASHLAPAQEPAGGGEVDAKQALGEYLTEELPKVAPDVDWFDGRYMEQLVDGAFAAMRLATPTPQAAACTCPSGDGSLRWPCPTHPPQAAGVSEAWALHLMGPDSIYAAPSYEAALRVANAVNVEFADRPVKPYAVVVPWNGDAKSHAAGLADWEGAWN